MSLAQHYEGYSWIKVPKYKRDENQPLDEQYKALETHHIQETTFLINEIRKLAKKLDQVEHRQ